MDVVAVLLLCRRSWTPARSIKWLTELVVHLRQTLFAQRRRQQVARCCVVQRPDKAAAEPAESVTHSSTLILKALRSFCASTLTASSPRPSLSSKRISTSCSSTAQHRTSTPSRTQHSRHTAGCSGVQPCKRGGGGI